MKRTPLALVGLAIAMAVPGLVAGLAQDVWGWWPYPLALVSLALWLIWRDPEAAHGRLAKRLLIAIAISLALVGLAGLVFVAWVSGFEF